MMVKKLRSSLTIIILLTLATDFFVIGIHTQPTNAIREINSLVDVYETFVKIPSNSNFQIGFIMGDFNYGGRYVPLNQQNKLAVDEHPYLRRIIDANIGTSVKTHLPYDRIYVGLTPKTEHESFPAIHNHGVDTFRGTLNQNDVSLYDKQCTESLI